MKVLFLDMDGVVNSARYFEVLSKRQYRKARGKAKAAGRRDFVQMIDPVTVPLLNAIVERTGAKVVISSSWRIPWTFAEIAAMLERRGFVGDVIDSTPNGVLLPVGVTEYERGHEIQAWLDGRPDIKAFAILDDSDDMAHLLPMLVQTSWARGLESEHVDLVVGLLDASRGGG